MKLQIQILLILYLVNLLRNLKEKQEPVLIHCRAEWGRTGTILAIYLMEFYDKTAREAIQEVRNLRPWSIETTEQEMAVLNYNKRQFKEEF